MRLYIAGSDQKAAGRVAGMCEVAGHQIGSSWLEEDFSNSSGYDDETKERIALLDVHEVGECDALVCLADVRRIPGGKFVEVGVALGLGKRVFLLGHRENLLMYHPLVTQFDSAEDFLTMHNAQLEQ